MKIYIPQMRSEIQAVTQFLQGEVRDYRPTQTDFAIASVDDTGIVGAVAYQNFRTVDIEMIAAGRPGWLNKGALRAYFYYPFGQLGCRRVTAICHRSNKRARRFVEKVGFQLEGVHKAAMDDGRDAISYGLLKENCKWIK